jgi:phage terminase small subunit
MVRDMTTRPLTPKQQRFVEEYLVDLNATQAAIRAGYSERTANRAGTRLLSDAVIGRAISAKQAERSARVQVDADYVLRNAVEVLERCMQRAPVLVRVGREIVQATDDQGRDVWQFDARGALGALEKLAKHIRFYPPEKIELGGEVKTGGVLVVPGAISPDQWAVAAEAQQAALVEQKRAMGEQYGVAR